MRALLSFRMAYAHVRATLGSMALSVVALALGVALVVAIQVMNVSVLEAFLDAIDGMAGRAALSITAGEGLAFDETVANQVAIDGVVKVVPIVTGVAFPDDRSGESLTVHAMDLADHEAVEVYHRGDTRGIIPDATQFFLRADSILLARKYAERRGLGVGSSFRLVTPKGAKTFTVRGLLDPEGLARLLGGRLVVMDLYAAEEVFTSTGQINRIDLVVQPGREDEVAKAVASVLPAGLTVEEPTLRKEVRRGAVQGFQGMLTAFALLAVVAGFVLCYSRFGAIFEARTWEVGLLRAVGLPRSVVFAEMLKESLLLGAAGVVLGLPVGILIARYGLPTMAAATAINFGLPVGAPALRLTPRAVIFGAAVGIGAAIGAALMPTLRLARRQPIAALTMRGRDMPDTGGGEWRVIGFLLVTVVGLTAWQQQSGLPLIGLLTTVCIALLACGLALPLVRFGARGLGLLWHRLFGSVGGLAAAHIVERYRRHAMAVAALGVGLAVVLMCGVVATSFEQTLVDRIARRTSAGLAITSAFQSGGYLGAPMTEQLRDQLLAVPGVREVVGQQRKEVTAQGTQITLDSYDGVCFTDPGVCLWSTERGALSDALELVARGQAALVTGPFARQHGLKPGDMLDIIAPAGLRRYLVAGVTRSELANVAIINRDEYRRHWKDPTVSWLYAAVGQTANVQDVGAEIARTLGERYRLQVHTRDEFVASLAVQAHKAFSLFYVVDALLFVLVTIGIGDTLATSVLERSREFGMLRAVGMRRATIFSLLMIEGVSIGVLGIALALVAGLVLGAFWVSVQFPALLGWSLDFYLPSEYVFFTAALAAGLCLLGSTLPALRGARLPVAVLLRNE